jgi:hypothetical protein
MDTDMVPKEAIGEATVQLAGRSVALKVVRLVAASWVGAEAQREVAVDSVEEAATPVVTAAAVVVVDIADFFHKKGPSV